MSEFDDFLKRSMTKPSRAASKAFQTYSWTLIAGLFLLALCSVVIFG